MFISRKELEEFNAWHIKQAQHNNKILMELSGKLDSLAKELGYEWTSEAVKEPVKGQLMQYVSDKWVQIYEGQVSLEEKAVLKWGWKKKDDFTEEWERQVEGKKLNSKSK